MTNTTPIILDRLSDALQAHGVKLRRKQLLNVAARAFGYRSDNAFSAAAKAGELDARRPDTLGVDDHGLVVLRDPVDGTTFAIDPPAEQGHGRQWCVSPAGGLVDIRGMRPQPTASITLCTATITHRHGTNFYIAWTPRELDTKIAGYCEEWWSEARQYDPDLPEEANSLVDDEIRRLYFGAVPDEFIETGTDTLTTPRAIARSIETHTGEAWVISRTNQGDADEPLLWWNGDDGWGDLASATIHPDATARLPMAVRGETVAWQRLPGIRAVAGQAVVTASGAGRWDDTAPTPHIADAASLLASAPIEAAPGIVLSRLVAQTTPSAGLPSGRRWRVVLRTDGVPDAGVVGPWLEETQATLSRAGATTRLDDEGLAIVFDGDADIHAATTVEDWHAAIGDLVRPVGDRERIMAEFRPEAWVRDHAIEVDAQGEPAIDVTYEMLLTGREAASELDSRDTDHLKEAVRAPLWIREWTGPFTISVADAVADTTLFG